MLKQHFEQSDKEQWGWNIVEFYLGNISEQTLMERLKADATDNTSLAEQDVYKRQTRWLKGCVCQTW